MDIFKHRRDRLRLLIKRYYKENQRLFSEETGIKAPQVNRWLSTTTTETRRITETSARNIEKRSGKVPDRWLDIDDEVAPQKPADIHLNEPPSTTNYITVATKPSARNSAIAKIMEALNRMDDVGIGMILERATAIAEERALPEKNTAA